MAKITIDDITPGQRWEQRGSFTWRVVRVIAFPGEDMRHVQLVNERDPSTTKTVSVDALLDKTLFRPVA
ncbi:MAG: hypothetical protein J0H82_34040 [Alphaproteobacteria bacterium]|jgi:hypothetical protein|nr:hypothetical protein [Alphaproteobacteria bacterium]